MNFTFYHNNINVYDLEKSLDFYQKALGLHVTEEKMPRMEASNWFTWEIILRPTFLS